METREYFEKVMQDYNQNRNGRSLRNILSSLRWKAAKPSGKDEAVDYNWLMEFKKKRGNYIEITASYVICGREFRPQKYLQRERTLYVQPKFRRIHTMASAYYEDVTCPKCHTKVRVRVTNGIYPMRTIEVANCPVCWEELFHKNITGDIEESVLSLDETIEPYLSEYKKGKAEKQ